MYDAAAFRAARHEGAHRAMCECLGWPVVGAWRGRGLSGRTEWIPRTDGDIAERAIENGMILVAPFLLDPIGCGNDARALQELARVGVSLSSVIDRAERMMTSEDFRRRHREALNELLSTSEEMMR
jgi:hypothetical protein